MEHKRIEYLDIARGLGILLVVFGHVVWGGNYPMRGAASLSNLIYSFHMPLFFILSGLCISKEKTLNKAVFLKMAKSYLVPYVIWSIIYIAAFEIIGLIRDGVGILSLDNYLIAHAISLCGLAPLWFLLALFIAEVVVLLIKPLIEDTRWFWVAAALLFVVSVFASFLYSHITSIDLVAKNYLMGALRIFPTVLFVLLGYHFKEKLLKCAKWNLWIKIVVLVGAVIIQLVLCYFWNEGIDVQLFILGNPILYFVKAVNGSFAVILFSQLIHGSFFTFLGRKTKELMILHYPPFYYTLLLSALLGKLFRPNIFGALIITAVTIAACLFIDWLLSRFKIWRFMMGKKS